MNDLNKKYLRPIEKITKNKNKVIQEVIKYAYNFIISKHEDKESIKKTLEYVISSEKNRINKLKYKFDPKDDQEFWNKVEKKVINDNSEQTNHLFNNILKNIIKRYVEEIFTPFSKFRFWLLKNVTNIIIRTLYKPFKPLTFGKNSPSIFDYFKVLGEYKLITNLAQKVTMVFVPTHLSHFDSLLVGSSLIYLNSKHKSKVSMPIYGGGYNLYKYKIFKYWISKCGIYSIDRRKINRVYIDTLKIYYQTLMMRGCNSLFYPGGTRSRNGSIENALKYGLLATPLETQKFSYEIDGPNAKKIIIVPISLNYESVFEADSLIKEDLKEYLTTTKLIKRPIKFKDILEKTKLLIKNGSGIRIIFGQPMDVLGNYVNEKIESIDEQKNVVNLYNEIKNLTLSKNEVLENKKKLESLILKEYNKSNFIFVSQIIAKAAFNLIEEKYSDLEDNEFWNIDVKKIILKQEDIKKEVLRLEKILKSLNNAPIIDEKIEELKKQTDLSKFIEGLGAFHKTRPLIITNDGSVKTENLMLLYYYSNRLSSYVSK